MFNLFSRGPRVLLQEVPAGAGEGADRPAAQAHRSPQPGGRQDPLAQERQPHDGRKYVTDETLSAPEQLLNCYRPFPKT
jgi:hypothetical protein